jgi:hypothetical protein
MVTRHSPQDTALLDYKHVLAERAPRNTSLSKNQELAHRLKKEVLDIGLQMCSFRESSKEYKFVQEPRAGTSIEKGGARYLFSIKIFAPLRMAVFLIRLCQPSPSSS